MLEVHAILQRQRCNENITKKTGTLSDAYGAKNTISITNGRFLENTIPLPNSSEETKRLAWLLTAIQNKMVLELDLLSNYQKQKQYLLRQMFI